MKVGDFVSACEYTHCVVLNALGEEITNDDYKRIYELSVEHLSAKDDIVQIWTFEKWNEFEEECVRKGENV